MRLDAAKNEVVVGPRSALTTTGLILRDVNWLGENSFAESAGNGLELFVRMRSSQKLRAALVTADGETGGKVELHDGEEGIATGQACVFYASQEPGARVLGGGWIAKTVKAANQGDYRAQSHTLAEAPR